MRLQLSESAGNHVHFGQMQQSDEQNNREGRVSPVRGRRVSDLQNDDHVHGQGRGVQVQEEDQRVRTVLPDKRWRRERPAFRHRRRLGRLRDHDRAGERVQGVPAVRTVRRRPRRRRGRDRVPVHRAGVRAKREHVRHGNTVRRVLRGAAPEVPVDQRRNVRDEIEDDRRQRVPVRVEMLRRAARREPVHGFARRRRRRRRVLQQSGNHRGARVHVAGQPDRIAQDETSVRQRRRQEPQRHVPHTIGTVAVRSVHDVVV